MQTLFVKEYQLYLLKGIDCICVNTILLILLIRNKGRRNELQRNIQSRGDEFKAVQAAADKKEQAHRTHTYKPPHHYDHRHSFQDSNYHKNDQIPKFQKEQALREAAKSPTKQIFLAKICQF